MRAFSVNKILTARKYCKHVKILPKNDFNRIYHDTQCGFPIKSNNELFGKLILEINQAGLSWTAILNKQDNFREAYDGIDIQKVAKYRTKDINRLLGDAGIIPGKRKIAAATHNAR